MQTQQTQLNFPTMLAQVLRANQGNRITEELMQGLLTAAIQIHKACLQAEVQAALDAHMAAQAAAQTQAQNTQEGAQDALV